MVVIAILESKDFTKFSVEELIDSLMSHEARLSLDDPPLEHAFKYKDFINRGNIKGCQGRRGKGRENHQT